MKGILADVNIRGQVNDLAREMQSGGWLEFWTALGLTLYHFEDLGLSDTSSDRDIWIRCQAAEVVLLTNNRNLDAEDSLEATIRELGKANHLPVFTIGNMTLFQSSRPYVERVIERLFEHLLQIDNIRGAGRIFVP